MYLRSVKANHHENKRDLVHRQTQPLFVSIAEFDMSASLDPFLLPPKMVASNFSA